MMHQVGDIVEYENHRWVVARREATSIPVGAWILLRDDRDGLRISKTAYGGWTLLARPTFNDGDVLRFEGQRAIVRADEGATIRLEIDRDKIVRPNKHSGASLGTIAFTGIGTSVSRANLILANLNHFLNS